MLANGTSIGASIAGSRNDTNGSFILVPSLATAREEMGGMPSGAGDGYIALYTPLSTGLRELDLTASDGCSVVREPVVVRSTCPAKPSV